MAFDKQEVKQLKTLFDDQGNKIDQKVQTLFDDQGNKIDQKVQTLFDDQGNKIDKKVKYLFDGLEKRLGRKIDIKIEELARMTAAEFREVHKKLAKNDADHEEFRKDLSAHDFKMGELVHKAEYYHLEERVRHIETRLKIKPV